MLGTIVNTTTIVTGTIVGSCLKKGINPKFQDSLFNAMGFAATMLGINAVVSNMPDSKYPVLFIVSLALGSLFGSWIDLDGKFQGVMGRFSASKLGEGLSSAVLLYCIGTLSILGPVMSALNGDNTYLFTNATLDLVTSMVFASTYGIGMILAAPILFAWQGIIYAVAYFGAGAFFTDELMCELSIVGGILIAASGLNILKIKDSKTLNMLPALFVPIVFFVLKNIVGF